MCVRMRACLWASLHTVSPSERLWNVGANWRPSAGQSPTWRSGVGRIADGFPSFFSKQSPAWRAVGVPSIIDHIQRWKQKCSVGTEHLWPHAEERKKDRKNKHGLDRQLCVKLDRKYLLYVILSCGFEPDCLKSKYSELIFEQKHKSHDVNLHPTLWFSFPFYFAASNSDSVSCTNFGSCSELLCSKSAVWKWPPPQLGNHSQPNGPLAAKTHPCKSERQR